MPVAETRTRDWHRLSAPVGVPPLGLGHPAVADGVDRRETVGPNVAAAVVAEPCRDWHMAAHISQQRGDEGPEEVQRADGPRPDMRRILAGTTRPGCLPRQTKRLVRTMPPEAALTLTFQRLDTGHRRSGTETRFWEGGRLSSENV